MEDITTTCVESKLTYEIIVIDDCSTDESVARINQFRAADPGVPVILRVVEKPRAGL